MLLGCFRGVLLGCCRFLPPEDGEGGGFGGETPGRAVTEDESSDSESDDDAPQQQGKKKIPSWARGTALKRALIAQATNPDLDPDAIFPCQMTVDLAEIFGSFCAKKKRYANRGSSGNWTKDRVTQQEEQQYRRARYGNLTPGPAAAFAAAFAAASFL